MTIESFDWKLSNRCGSQVWESIWASFKRFLTGSSPGHLNVESFAGASLRGGTSIRSITLTSRPIIGIAGTPATAVTSTNLASGQMTISIASGLPLDELSRTIYHEVLEAAWFQAEHKPTKLSDISEAMVDELAARYHQQLGMASVESLNTMLTELGF